jgi:hypothetical protein
MSIVANLREQIAKLEAKITAIQKDCNHPASAVTRKHRADMGNYDRSMDGYWDECECGLCEKRWTEDQKK